MLKLIKDRFSDFKRSEYLVDFFKSASFTLYILTIHLCLPDNYFFRIAGRYDQVTYENTIKLIIRCKIFYEARNILSDILKMISEREYSAALVQTEIATIDSCDLINESEAENLKKSLKTLMDQSSYIDEEIEKFRKIKPFDRPFLYQGGEYTKTMKEFYIMLNRVLEVHEIDLNKL